MNFNRVSTKVGESCQTCSLLLIGAIYLSSFSSIALASSVESSASQLMTEVVDKAKISEGAKSDRNVKFSEKSKAVGKVKIVEKTKTLGETKTIENSKVAEVLDARPWTEFARRLFGETNEVLEESIKNLKANPDLNGILKRAIETDVDISLALDVISSLRMYSMMGPLIEKSRYDKTGVVYQAINALVNSKNKKQLIKLYEVRLKMGPLSFPSRIVIIDTLGRYGHKLPKESLLEWLSKGNFELQSATLNYMRRIKSELKNDEFKELLELALKSSFFQTRLQVIYAFPYYLLNFELCKNDEHEEVKKICKEKSLSKDVDW